MILYRPTGIKELAIVFENGCIIWPQRLPEQPFFYPVLNQDYAVQIARDWNTKGNDFAGYVTRFAVNDEYVAKFQKQVVGGKTHEELWIPANELNDFNQHIEGPIDLVEAFFGSCFEGLIPEKYNIKDKTAKNQIKTLIDIYHYNGMDFICELAANSKYVFLHFPFWLACSVSDLEVSVDDKARVMEAIKSVWNSNIRIGKLCENGHIIKTE